LGLTLAVDRKTFLEIAGDFGRLYREKKYLYGGEFDRFFASKGKRYKKAMEAAAENDENLACFMRREQAYIDAMEDRKQPQSPSPEAYTGIRLSLWLSKNADGETVEGYAAAYREQTQPELRAKALEAFVRCCYPDNPQPIIEDCQSDCEELRKVAWRALENIRHPEVRGFALNNAAKGLRTPENFALLVTNYTSEDAVMLEELLRELIAAKDWDSVHAAGMDILRLFDKDSTIPRPKHLLPLLYEFTPCSFCRESALVSMSRHRMLTREMLEECQFDCNDDIRSMAAKRLK